MRFTGNRRAFVVAAVSAGLLTAGGVAATGALAATNGQGNLYANNAYCGGAQDATQPGEGFIVVHRTDATHVSVNYHLKGAQPGATYTVWLYSGSCSFDATLGTVTANSNGVANANFKDVTVPAGDTSVFTFSFGGSQSVESEAVSVPAS
jgi:hypothetical protein